MKTEIVEPHAARRPTVRRATEAKTATAVRATIEAVRARYGNAWRRTRECPAALRPRFLRPPGWTPRWVLHAALRLGIPLSLPSADRIFLEERILPYFGSNPGYDRVLFIGCEWFTAGYERFFPGAAFWTLEPVPDRARYGSARHLVDRLAGLDRHVSLGQFDLVICNGVVGWGLDDLAEATASFAACARALRPGGVLLVGWNDAPAHRPFDLDAAIDRGQLQPWSFPPQGRSRIVIQNHRMPHVFDFFVRRGGA